GQEEASIEHVGIGTVRSAKTVLKRTWMHTVGEEGRQRRHHALSIFRVDAVLPPLRGLSDFLLRVAEQGFKSLASPNFAREQVPIPHRLVSGLGSELKATFAFPKRFLDLLQLRGDLGFLAIGK